MSKLLVGIAGAVLRFVAGVIREYDYRKGGK